MVSSLIIEPIIFVTTVWLLPCQPLHLLLSSTATRLRERGHVISTSVIEQNVTPDTSHTLVVVNKKVTEKDLTRLGKSLTLLIRPAIWAVKKVVDIMRRWLFLAILFLLGVRAML